MLIICVEGCLAKLALISACKGWKLSSQYQPARALCTQLQEQQLAHVATSTSWAVVVLTLAGAPVHASACLRIAGGVSAVILRFTVHRGLSVYLHGNAGHTQELLRQSSRVAFETDS